MLQETIYSLPNRTEDRMSRAVRKMTCDWSAVLLHALSTQAKAQAELSPRLHLRIDTAEPIDTLAMLKAYVNHIEGSFEYYDDILQQWDQRAEQLMALGKDAYRIYITQVLKDIVEYLTDTEDLEFSISYLSDTYPYNGLTVYVDLSQPRTQ